MPRKLSVNFFRVHLAETWFSARRAWARVRVGRYVCHCVTDVGTWRRVVGVYRAAKAKRHSLQTAMGYFTYGLPSFLVVIIALYLLFTGT